jgi:hypothetical protein
MVNKVVYTGDPIQPFVSPEEWKSRLGEILPVEDIDGWRFQQDVNKAAGLKYDDKKPRMDLLDADFLEGVASVLTFGANKYAAHNWRGGINYSRLLAASYRHLGAINRGEDVDPESGLEHVYHLSCCLMFLSWMMSNRKDLDDRWKPNGN